MSSKITIIGAGSVGSTIAYTLSNQDIASEIVLIDINKEKVAGEVMDIREPASATRSISKQVNMRMRKIPISLSSPPVLQENQVRHVLSWHRQM